MKKALSILLLGVFLFNMVGFYWLFKAQLSEIRSEIKHRIKQGIPEEELHLFTFTTTQLAHIEWTRAGKEFKHGQEMYDVVRKEVKGDTTYYWCVNDTEEKQLFADLDEMISKELGDDQDDQHHPISKKRSKPIKSLVYTLPAKYSSNFLSAKGVAPNNGINLLYASPVLEAISPPPQLV